MKKITFLFIAFVAISFTKTPVQEGAILNLLCSGKWVIEYAMIGDVKREFSEERSKSTWLVFYKDGTNDAMSPEGLHKGTWKYDAEKKEITFTENSKFTKGKDQVTVQKIKQLDKNKLVLETSARNQVFAIHFKKE
ncbi:hypothetical protein RQM59_12790 [Flavobacteriaceae bacterium S356]|uniref:Lipocalin-like domain-containing protein n=1 Tax=Asprobacillus argus TaxID=3076534 RepID=A0ABU3LHS4_9FLAO|nr:hypothetical protein [Flavobacteriaceae bacterium S356]